MENLSHSYSKRSYHNANGFTATASKSPYDDVFRGRTKFNVPTLSPRLEDYTEVFGGFHSSRPYCIPILDLPLAGNGEVEVPFDVRSSRFDYSEIFGGFNDVDFAVSYEDLLRQSSAGYDSSDQAWSPSSSFKGSADYAFERILGETSPPFFGEEVDTSSPTAALKDAIARAQAKCQRAKESMEKKKQGLQSCKQHSGNISTADVTNSMFDEPVHCKDHSVTGKLEREDSQGEAFAEESESMRTEDDLVLDLSEGREHSNFSGKSTEGKKCKEYGLYQEAHRIEGTIAWREAVEFFEIETCPPGDTYESFKYGKHCMDAHDQKHLLVAVIEAFEQQETCKTFRHSKGAPEWEEDRKQVKTEKEVYEFGEQCGRSVKVSQNLFDLELNAENISEDSDEVEEIEYMIEDGGKLKELDEVASYNEQITIDCESGEALDRACVSNDVTLHVPQVHEKVEKIFKKLETTQAALSCDKNELKITEGNNGELESEIGANNLLARERLNSLTEKQENMQYGKSKVVREVARKPPCLDAHFTNSKDVVNGMGNSSFKREKTASEMACHSENIQRIIHEGPNKINVSALQFAIYKEVDNEKFAWHQMVRDGAENREKIGDALSVVQEDGEILSRIDQRSTNYCRGRKEMSSNEFRNIDEQKFEILKKEKEQENEYLRKIEAEREREREREKDLMAVSLNTLEKPYAEANGKIERAASEMWQRGTADVKKLVKASAEARQCASEKATAEKTAHDTRERVDTLSSHRFHTSSENTLMRQGSFSSDLLEHKNHGKSKLRYSFSSANAGIEGESPQRCKARLERYQRTAERAAKALAEKNMLDLLAQREQVERNRLAETLDAEVKRWSSGKEGNLRALLSTLQYILGPESGWHPIPLTEVITSAAVKRAFRKATLCVHPDKLQQRGASVQQKYICEKVFDLLKEAWNKFTSEER